MQDGATAHTANYSINVLNKVSEDWPGADCVTCKVSRFKPVIFNCGEI
jgi:hypothetical protein